jgi:CspA family cold shock protein
VAVSAKRKEAGVSRGTVKKVIVDRGFGFIRSEDGREIFFHRSGLVGTPFEAIREGQAVEFDLEEATRGPRASNVRTEGKAP